MRSALSACASSSGIVSVRSPRPGMSTSVTVGRPSSSSRYSVAREVVGKGPTAHRISCANAFNRQDFPALTWPIRTMRTGAIGAAVPAASRACAARTSSSDSASRPE